LKGACRCTAGALQIPHTVDTRNVVAAAVEDR